MLRTPRRRGALLSNRQGHGGRGADAATDREESLTISEPQHKQENSERPPQLYRAFGKPQKIGQLLAAFTFGCRISGVSLLATAAAANAATMPGGSHRFSPTLVNIALHQRYKAWWENERLTRAAHVAAVATQWDWITTLKAASVSFHGRDRRTGSICGSGLLWHAPAHEPRINNHLWWNGLSL